MAGGRGRSKVASLAIIIIITRRPVAHHLAITNRTTWLLQPLLVAFILAILNHRVNNAVVFIICKQVVCFSKE
jgi:hypothetical protein